MIAGTTATIYLIAAAGVIGIGVYGLLAADHLLRKLLALNLLGSGIFLLMVTLPSRGGTPDPLTHALVLTGLVIAVSVTAFGLALLDRLYRETGEIRIDAVADASTCAASSTASSVPSSKLSPTPNSTSNSTPDQASEPRTDAGR